MSGVLKSISKVFKKVGDAVSSVVKSDAFKTALIVGFVWMTAGAATGAFAAPETGMASTLGAEAGGTFTGASEIFGGVETVTGGAVAETAAVGTNSVLAPTASTAYTGTEAASVADMVSNATTGAALPASPAVAAAPVDPTMAANPAGGVAPGTQAAAGGANAPGSGRILGWMEKNPMATMMLGQGAMGAASSYEADKAAEREEERLRNRGLMGVDYSGNYRGRPEQGGGIVAGNMGRDATQAQVVNSPQVTGVQGSGQRKVRPVARNKLPELRKQGLIARQKAS